MDYNNLLTNKMIFCISLIFISIIKLAKSHSCGFNDHKMDKIYKMMVPEEEKRNLQTTDYLPIRIYFDYTTLDNQTQVDDTLRSGIKQILGNAQNVFQSLLKVKRFPYKLKFNQCDDSVTINNTIKTQGIDTDIVIFPYVDTSITSNTEAYASACVMAVTNNRPVAGVIAFTLATKTNKTNWLEFYTNLALHEITHILVFNPSMFNAYVDSNNQLLGLKNVIKTQEVNGVNRTMIITPKVVAAAKKHFNCSEVTGVELEDLGGAGTAGSHWEARIMLGDYMIGVSLDESAMSDITLALFEDSGWYSVNYYSGGLMRFGKNEGCDFLNKKCLTNGAVAYPEEFCNVTYAQSCSTGRTSRAICYITAFNGNIPTPYQYFPNVNQGGFPYADYCPVKLSVTNMTYFLPYNCRVGYSTFPASYSENISTTSSCFMSSLSKQTISYSENANVGVCYQYGCNSNFTISVIVGGISNICSYKGQKINFVGYTGSLTCPDYNQICTGTVPCVNIIDCINKKSLTANSTTVKYSSSQSVITTIVSPTPSESNPETTNKETNQPTTNTGTNQPTNTNLSTKTNTKTDITSSSKYLKSTMITILISIYLFFCS